jgi:hypothetical protein
MSHPTPIDITTMPELSRIVEKVEATRKPLELRRENRVVAVIAPAKNTQAHMKRGKTKADYEAFKSAAGGWKDIDTDKLIENIYAIRRRSNRPPVKI